MSVQLADEVMATTAKKLNDKKYNAEGFGKTIHFVFKDIATCYRLKFAMDGTVTIDHIPESQAKESDAVSTVYYTKVEVWKGQMEGNTNPMDSMGDGSMTLAGDMDALYKLMPAMG